LRVVSSGEEAEVSIRGEKRGDTERDADGRHMGIVNDRSTDPGATGKALEHGKEVHALADQHGRG
jgi:hypothetical protein